MRGRRYAKEDGDELMASNEITARVALQGEIKANATLGVPVEVYVDREIYDGETVITPTEDDITLETAGKAVLENILVHGIPKAANIVEGEFIGTEEGILQVDIPYNGDTFPKMIIVYVKDEIANLTGNFIANANIYGINVCQLLKMYSTTPSYNGNSNANFARLVLLYKASNSGYNQQTVSGYSYNQGSCRWNADCLKIRDNKTMDVFIKNERDPETGGIYFMQGIRYTYQVFY